MTAFDRPRSSAPGDAVAEGSDSAFARSDHQHGREAFATTEIADVAATEAAGSSATVARGDHAHAVPATITSYTPALTASTTDPTLGTGSTATSKYSVLGDMLDYEGKIAFGTSGTNPGSGSYRLSLPVSVQQHDGVFGTAKIVDASAGTIAVATLFYVSATTLGLYLPSYTALAVAGAVTEASPMGWDVSDEINFRVRCRVT